MHDALAGELGHSKTYPGGSTQSIGLIQGPKIVNIFNFALVSSAENIFSPVAHIR